MNFSIGDKVRFLNEKGEGTVTRIINKNTVGITIEEGFEIPFVTNELVKITDNNMPAPTQKKMEAEEPFVPYISKKEERKRERDGIYLALSPENPKDLSRTGFNVWLINHTSFDLSFCCSTPGTKGYTVFAKGESKPFESKLIETIAKKQLDEYATIKIDALFFSYFPFEHESPVSELIKLKAARLYKENIFATNSFIPEMAMIINISGIGEELFFDKPESANVDLSKLLFQKQKPQQIQKQSKPATKNNPAYEMEIDLHIEELLDDYSRMSNAEIIQLQLRHFQQALDKAINNNCRSLTVIHGVGNGRLKQEVRNILIESNIRFQDGSYSKYGFGATEVLIH